MLLMLCLLNATMPNVNEGLFVLSTTKEMWNMV